MANAPTYSNPSGTETDALGVVLINTSGEPYNASGGGGGGGDASSANQLDQIDIETDILTALQIIDDWDESDRAKVNLIVGQAGVAAGAGAVGATVQRATLASDDPAVVALQIMDDWDESDRAKVNPIAGQAGVAGGSGTVSALTQRVVLATDVALPAGENRIGSVGGYMFSEVVTPTVTNGAYSAGDIVGGLLTFTVARVNDEPVMITGVQVSLKAAVTSTLTVVLFDADPTSTTKTDNAAYSLNAADTFKVRGAVTGFTLTDHGTPNTYRAEGLNIIMKPSSGARTIFALVIDGTGFTLTSTSDMQVRISGTGP